MGTFAATREQWHEALKKAVAERGADFRYEDDPEFAADKDEYATCANTVNGRAACIVGLAYYNLFGELVPEVHQHDNVTSILHYLDIADAGEETLQWALSDAQTVQDNEGTWGEALSAFEKSIIEGGY